MWEDDHISSHLLQIHLDQETDAASRKRTTILKTVQWIESHLGGGGKEILDLGCGPGLYCELLADHGHQVTGVDFSKRSLTYAKQRAAAKNLAINYLHQNYLAFRSEIRYDLVMMIYCDFDILTPGERDRLLQIIVSHLRPGGIFVFDSLNCRAPGRMNMPGRTWEAAKTGFWMDTPYLALSENFHYEKEQVILQQHIICSELENPAIYRFWTHYYDPGNLSLLLQEQGFSSAESFEGLLPDDGAGTGEMVTFYIARKG